jgi:hypothetical protein
MVSSFMAEGAARFPLRSAISETAVVLAIAILLTASLGEVAVGLAMTVSTVVATIVLAVGSHPALRGSLLAIAKTTAIAALAAGSAQAFGFGNDVQGLLLSLGVVTIVWAALEVAFSRDDLRRVARLARPLLRRSSPA